MPGWSRRSRPTCPPAWQRCRTHYAREPDERDTEVNVASGQGDAAQRLRPARPALSARPVRPAARLRRWQATRCPQPPRHRPSADILACTEFHRTTGTRVAPLDLAPSAATPRPPDGTSETPRATARAIAHRPQRNGKRPQVESSAVFLPAFGFRAHPKAT